MKLKITGFFGILITLFSIYRAPDAQALERIRLGSIQGTVQAHGMLQLTAIEPYILCKYCKVSTCAGGPRSIKILKLGHVTGLPGQVASFQSKAGTLVGLHPLARLDSCSVGLHLEGLDPASGEPVSGQVTLAYSRATDDEKFWKDSNFSEAIQNKLDRILIEIEIRQAGIADPAIELVPNSEWERK